jgi:hypothetical protein
VVAEDASEVDHGGRQQGGRGGQCQGGRRSRTGVKAGHEHIVQAPVKKWVVGAKCKSRYFWQLGQPTED